MDNEMQQTNPNWYKDLQYQDVKVYIRDNINSASRSFVAIGYYLKYVRDNQLYSEDGYATIWEFAQKCLDEINEKLSEVGRGLKQNHQLPRCTHEADTECNMINIKPIAESLGIDCNGKCCWGCKELCGARCNASAHRPEATGIVSIEPEENRIPDPDLSCRFDPDAKCLTASKESCKRINDDRCMYSSGWDEEDYITVDPEQSVELDPVETVEADIIQTEPEEYFNDQCADRGLKFNNWLKANNFSIAQIVSDILCDIPLANDKDPFLSSKVTNRLISSLIIKTDAYYSYLTKELDIEPEPVKSEQPELPILRNNDQRKEFIDAYETWPVWIDQELTGERYYRYDFDNSESFVIRVSLCRKYLGWDKGYSKELAYGREEYFILKKDLPFVESGASKSMMIDYLKEIQKKGVNK